MNDAACMMCATNTDPRKGEKVWLLGSLALVLGLEPLRCSYYQNRVTGPVIMVIRQ